MSNLIVNIRVLYWHLQISEGFRGVKIVKNDSIKTLKGIPKIQIFN